MTDTMKSKLFHALFGILIVSMQIHPADRDRVVHDVDPTKMNAAARKLKIQNNPAEFELINNMSVPLQVTLENDDFNNTFLLPEKKRLIKGEDIVPYQAKIDKEKQTILHVSFSKPNGDVDQKSYRFPAGKFLYLAYEDGVLKPQNSSSGKTKGGLIIQKTNINPTELMAALIKHTLLAKKEYDEDDGFDDVDDE